MVLSEQTFRILITGSRDWRDVVTIRKALEKYKDPPFGKVVLVSGRCPTGADYICELYARAFGWEIEPHPADWKRYKKQAGPIRNAEMVAAGADVCLAFIRNASPGSTGCATLAKEADIPTYVYNENSEGRLVNESS